jgi:hypothetical protein
VKWNFADVGLSILRRFLYPKSNVAKVAFMPFYECLIYHYYYDHFDLWWLTICDIHLKTEDWWRQSFKTCKKGNSYGNPFLI